ncbi:hypothetical protein CALCODRAFT_111277 [Calocera cornea HHB12733]|uniref:Uncharacterized protein n=1 Tax=Calocera cornea HHB12733 TaxID=1353952 RepID=A0A165D1U2_9BASI|nr:hypothetical protein CALCODRAFT_111277 [Calocera cornea HHB12733]
MVWGSDFPSVTWKEYIATCHYTTPVIGYTDFQLPADAVIPAYAMLQTAVDFNVSLVDQMYWDYLPNTVPSATVPIVLSGTIVGAVLQDKSGAETTSWVTSGITAQPTPNSQSSTSSTSQTAPSSSSSSTSSGTGTSSDTSSTSSPRSLGSNNGTSAGAPGSSSTPSSPQSSPSSGSDGNSTQNAHSIGATIGGVVGGISVLVLIIIAIVLLRRERKRRQLEQSISPFSDDLPTLSPTETRPSSTLPPRAGRWFTPKQLPTERPMRENAAPAAGPTLRRPSQAGITPYASGSRNPDDQWEGPSRMPQEQYERTIDRLTGYSYSRGGTPPPNYEELSRRETGSWVGGSRGRSILPSSSSRPEVRGGPREKAFGNRNRAAGQSYPL